MEFTTPFYLFNISSKVVFYFNHIYSCSKVVMLHCVLYFLKQYCLDLLDNDPHPRGKGREREGETWM